MRYDLITWDVDPLHSYAHGQTLREACSALKPQAVQGDHQRLVSLAWADLVFTTICHGTNWYRLREYISTAASEERPELQPWGLVSLSLASFHTLTGLDAGTPDGALRREMLQKLGAWAMKTRFNRTLSQWVSQGVRLGGGDGFYATLKTFDAFGEDPLEKKLRVLAHQLYMSDLVDFADHENFRPAIDYHLIRLYMRTSRISPKKYTQLAGFRSGHPVSRNQLTHIRCAVEQAMYYTAEGAEASIPVLNHVEWQIGRSHCTREGPRCEVAAVEAKPLDPPLASLSDQVGGCPFRAVCLGRGRAEVLNVVEPVSMDAYY